MEFDMLVVQHTEFEFDIENDIPKYFHEGGFNYSVSDCKSYLDIKDQEYDYIDSIYSASEITEEGLDDFNQNMHNDCIHEIR